MSANSSKSTFRVNDYGIGEQGAPDISVGSLGNFVITWQSEDQDGDGDGVYAKIYNAAAVPLGTEFRVNTTTRRDQTNPAVAVDASSSFVVVWTSDQSGIGGTGSSRQDVYGQRFSSIGSPLGAEFRINRSILQDQYDPDVATDASGNFVVVYTSEEQDDNTNGRDSSGTGIFGQRFDRTGALVGPEFRINTQTQNDQTAPVVAMNARGEFVVVWVSEGQDGSGEAIFGQRYSDTGLAVGAEFQVGTATEDSQINPSIALDNSGRFVVTWQSEGQDDNQANDDDGYGIYAQQYSASGNPHDQFLVNSTTDGDQVNPSVAVGANGNFSIVWASDDQDGDGYGIFGQRFRGNGKRQGREFQVNRQTDKNQTRPVVGATAAADFLVAWQSEIGDSDQQDIFARVTVSEQEIRGTRADDTLRGTRRADRILGLEGDDTLQGLGGNDTLEGGAGDDDLQGGDNNDILQGGSDKDTLDGGEGDDAVTGSGGADTFVLRIKRGRTLINDFQDGTDVLGLSAGITTQDIQLQQQGNSTLISWRGIDLATLLGVNTQDITSTDFVRASRSGKVIRGNPRDNLLTGTTGGDEIIGFQGNDTLLGRAGNDSLVGGAGRDRLLGEVDNDTLSGDNGNDLLEGGQGDDTLTAGNGDDSLTGGAGADIFVLQIKTGLTIITDFQDGIDLFSLDDITPSQLQFRQQGADAVISAGGQTLALVKNINASLLTTTPSDIA